MAELKIYGSIVQEKWLDSDVTPTDVREFISELSPNDSLDVRVNSYGGSVTDGLAIYQTIKAHKGKTTVYIDGAACSIASVIAFAGDELIMPESSLLMIHLPYVGLVANKIEMKKTIETLETMENSIMNVYANNLLKASDKSKIEQFMTDEKWFSANEASQYFKVTVQEETNREAEAVVVAASKPSVLSKFKENKKTALSRFSKVASSGDQSEDYKQSILKKYTNEAMKRQSQDVRLKVTETKENILSRFSKKGGK